LNGPYAAAGLTIDFYPKNSNHGDSREQLNVQMRNTNGSNGTGLYQSKVCITLAFLTVSSRPGITNNKLSVWVQMGISWLKSVPIEITKYGSGVMVHTTNQPYYSDITDTGVEYPLKTHYAIKEDHFEFGGTVHSTDLIVEPNAWPDYVFESDYELKTLDQVAEFIKENGHLPNIPSAGQVVEEGISVSEINVSLVEKIEELTLYTIDQQKGIDDQKAQLKAQNEVITKLLERVEKLETKSPNDHD